MEEIKKVNATYRTIGKFMNVLVGLPGRNDQCMRWVPEHQMNVCDEIVTVPDHYTRPDFILNEKKEKILLLRNFFGTEIGETAQNMVADVTVLEKTDYDRGGKKFLVIDIRDLRPTSGTLVKWKLLFNQLKGNFPIPSTDRFVAFKQL